MAMLIDKILMHKNSSQSLEVLEYPFKVNCFSIILISKDFEVYKFKRYDRRKTILCIENVLTVTMR
jgi:hypothetical protein